MKQAGLDRELAVPAWNSINTDDLADLAADPSKFKEEAPKITDEGGDDDDTGDTGDGGGGTDESVSYDYSQLWTYPTYDEETTTTTGWGPVLLSRSKVETTPVHRVTLTQRVGDLVGVVVVLCLPDSACAGGNLAQSAEQLNTSSIHPNKSLYKRVSNLLCNAVLLQSCCYGNELR